MEKVFDSIRLKARERVSHSMSKRHHIRCLLEKYRPWYGALVVPAAAKIMEQSLLEAMSSVD